jgi:hypothetical protein
MGTLAGSLAANAADAEGHHVPAVFARALAADITCHHVHAPTATLLTDPANFYHSAPRAKAVVTHVTEGGFVSLTHSLLTPAAMPKKVVVLTATDPVHAGWCSALCKGVHRREKWREWPRDVHTSRQLALAH